MTNNTYESEGIMARNLVICCDGTWNTPSQTHRGVLAPTNVVRIYNAIVEDENQLKYYHPGVGTDGNLISKYLGGSTGTGLSRNIMSAYQWLCSNYNAGDNIFLFGFSRGAYTVRSLAGMIGYCGLLHDEEPDTTSWDRIKRLFEKGYRAKVESRPQWDVLGWTFHDNQIPIHFVGVWDTVGALGIPDDLGLLNLVDNPNDHNFHDCSLSLGVRHARHAVAMDEIRKSFQPTLWSNAATHPDAQERWFPGVHSDVGGGYHEAGLANGALRWMIVEAANCGLVFNEAMVDQIQGNIHDLMHDSCVPPFSALPTQPRAVPKFGKDAVEYHNSAFERHLNPPVHQSPYRVPHRTPDGRGIEVYAAEKWNASGVWLEAGTTYIFRARGSWLDSSIVCGAAGADDGNFQLGEIGQMFGSLLGGIEEEFKRLTGNTSAQFRFTRRHEDMPWFALAGAIANGGGADAKGHIQDHETFLIGDGCTYTPMRSGYFYAYANDAWNCYGNNRGRVTLSIALQK